MELKNIKYEKKGHICIMTIDHPPANAWNLDTMTDFGKALDQAESDKDVRVIVLTGAGEKCFSAGFDVSDSKNAAETGTLGQNTWERVDRFSKPIIAAINGMALGGGLELAMSCHFRIMADAPKTLIGLTELNLGIIPGWGGTQRLTSIVGKSKALKMILFSKRIGANEAFEIGLVDQVSSPEKLMDDALEMAEALAKRPPIAVSCVLKAISAGQYEGLPRGLKTEYEGGNIVMQSKDKIEGFTAFMEKREPNFTGE